ncbi:MAG: type toxin-antitoxin system VapC family toxin [Mucilaginibacter sp.]|nr:type toxin-antitoxin system VapC family toxin [Mucilaginibacter sp.]
MAEKIVLADTPLFIDFFRKSDKSKSHLISLMRKVYEFCIGAITGYELNSGATESQIEYWRKFLEKINIIPVGQAAMQEAVNINNILKAKRKQIELADLFIAAVPMTNNLPVATLNKKHFERVESLVLVE